MNITAFELAERFVGIKEIEGVASDPQILAMLRLDNRWPQGDEVPWCSAFVNYVAWLLRLPRSKSLRARSWLGVGTPVGAPETGFDIVILKRGEGNQPGPEVLDAPGHVGFYAGMMNGKVYVLGGNQSNAVNVKSYNVDRILGFRRLGA